MIIVKSIIFYEKINNEVKNQGFKRIDEFNKNQKWCKTCRKTIVNNESV